MKRNENGYGWHCLIYRPLDWYIYDADCKDGNFGSMSLLTNHVHYFQVLMENIITRFLGQYQGCWCPGSLRSQAINSHVIGNVLTFLPTSSLDDMRSSNSRACVCLDRMTSSSCSRRSSSSRAWFRILVSFSRASRSALSRSIANLIGKQRPLLVINEWHQPLSSWICLTHWGQVTHICVSKLTIISSDNGLSPGRRQAIIWNNAGILLIEPWEQTSVNS